MSPAPIVDPRQTQVLSSAEKFKENEKNLCEDRLKRESKLEIPITSDSKISRKETPKTETLNFVNMPNDKNLERNVSQHQFAGKS